MHIKLVFCIDKGQCQYTLKAECVVRPPGYSWAANAAVAVGMTIRPREQTLSHMALTRNVLPQPALPSTNASRDSPLSTADMISS